MLAWWVLTLRSAICSIGRAFGFLMCGCQLGTARSLMQMPAVRCSQINRAFAVELRHPPNLLQCRARHTVADRAPALTSSLLSHTAVLTDPVAPQLAGSQARLCRAAAATASA